MNQDNGRIEDVARKKAKNGTPYASVRIDGENYTCWDDALISKLESGQDVDYQWEQSGKFKKIIDIEPVLDDLELSPKDLRILRMSALRSASYLCSRRLGSEPFELLTNRSSSTTWRSASMSPSRRSSVRRWRHRGRSSGTSLDRGALRTLTETSRLASPEEAVYVRDEEPSRYRLASPRSRQHSKSRIA